MALMFLLAMFSFPRGQAVRSCGSDPLQCYLQSLVIKIPDECFAISGGSELCVTNAEVYNLHVADIESSYSSSAPFTLNVDLVNAGAQVRGDYAYGRLMKGSVIGTTAMSLDLSILVATDESIYPLPSNVSFSFCAFPGITISLEFGNAVLDGLARAMESKIEAGIVNAVCTTLNADIANQTALKFETKLDPLLLDVIRFGPSVPAVYGTEYINWADSLIGKAHAFISKVVGCLERKFPNLVIPALPSLIDRLLDIATNGTGSITIVLPGAGFPVDLGNNTTLAVEACTISGLDTFGELAVLNTVPSSNVSLTSQARLDTLNMTFHLALNVTGAMGGRYSEKLVTTVSARHVLVSTELLLLALESKVNSLYLDQVLLSPECLLCAIQVASFSSIGLQLNMSEVVLSQVSSGGGSDIVALIDNSLQLALGGFQVLTTSLLAGLMQGPVRTALNAVIARALESSAASASCLPHTPSSTEQLIVWPESAALSKVEHLINDIMGAEKLNAAIKCAINGSFDMDAGPLHLHMDGLDSFSSIQILQPIDTFALRNEITLAALGKPLVVTMSALEKGKKLTGDTSTHSLEISAQNLSLAFDLLLELDMNKAMNLQWSQVGCPGCLASTLKKVAILPNMNASVANATLTASGKSKSVTRATQAILEIATGTKSTQAINNNLATWTGSSDALCKNGGVAPTDSGAPTATGSGPPAWWPTVLIVTSVACCFGLLAAAWHRSKSSKSSAQEMKERMVLGGGSTLFFPGSLLLDAKLPVLLRMMIPLLIVGNVVLFAVSNASVDAVTVQVTARIGGFSTSINAFGFSLSGTVRDMWDAKTYFIAVLIAFFSGCWPYVKLLVLLVAWVVPSNRLSVQRRYEGLKVVDRYGKFSLLDYYVMVLFMSAFYLKFQLADLGEVTVNVVPHFGFNSFLAATISSLVLGHVVIAAHRHCEGGVRENEDTSSDDRECLSSHNYSHSTAAGGEKVRITLRGKRWTAILLIITAGFFVAATCVHTFSFTFIGLTGLLLGNSATTTYSYYTVGQMLPTASGTPDDWKVRALQVAYYSFGVGMPAGLLAALAVVWWVPLSLKRQRQALVFLECLSAWSAIDVFLLSVFGALLQIQQFAAFIVGDSCDGINALLAKYMDGILEGQDVCFDLIANLLPETAWILFLAVLLISVVSISCMSMLEQSIKDRESALVVVFENGDCDLTDPLLLEPMEPVTGLHVPNSSFHVRLLVTCGLVETVV